MAGGTAATPNVAYTYDLGGFKGALSSVTSGSGAATNTMSFGQDNLGRTTSSSQTFGSGTSALTYNFGYGYTLTDQLLIVTYPSGRKVTYGYDGADRVSSIGGVTPGGAPTSYATGMTYTAASDLSQLPFANGVTEGHSWNDRLQHVGVQAGSLLTLGLYPCAGGATQCASGNNGLVRQQNISVGGTLQAVQGFNYDSVNRLTLAEEKAGGLPTMSGCSDATTWTQQFSYDGAGNRNVVCQTIANAWDASSISTSTNRVTGPNSWTYDAAGNMTATNSIAGGYAFSFDAAGRLAQKCQGAVCTNYIYDGLGNRVRETNQNGAATLTMAYDAFGNLAAEESATAPGTGFTPGTQYLVADHLGSPRLVMGAVTERHDYEPFGVELYSADGAWRGSVGGYPATASGNDSNGLRMKFTGQEREGDLDFFINRSYSPVQGRFISPDPGNAGADVMDPQTWNGYAYVGNSPLSAVDPDGLGPELIGLGAVLGPAGVAIATAAEVAIALGDIFGGTPGIPNWGHLPMPAGGSGNPTYGSFSCGGGVFGGGSSCPFVFSFDQRPSISAWDLPGQWFAGFIDLFFNGKPSGGARMVYAVGADLVGGQVIGKGVDCAKTAWALRNAQFAQKTASAAFSEGGKLAGQTVQGVGQALKSGTLSASDVPVQYVVKDGATILLNTRSAMSLTLGGIGRASWNAVDATADLGANLRLAGQLARNPGGPFSAARLGGGCTVSLGK